MFYCWAGQPGHCLDGWTSNPRRPEPTRPLARVLGAEGHSAENRQGWQTLVCCNVSQPGQLLRRVDLSTQNSTASTGGLQLPESLAVGPLMRILGAKGHTAGIGQGWQTLVVCVRFSALGTFEEVSTQNFPISTLMQCFGTNKASALLIFDIRGEWKPASLYLRDK